MIEVLSREKLTFECLGLCACLSYGGTFVKNGVPRHHRNQNEYGHNDLHDGAGIVYEAEDVV